VEVKSSTGLARLGHRTFGKREELIFLGREISEQRDYSDKIAIAIDEQVHDLVDNAYDIAYSLLIAHRSKLEQIAQYLIEYETVEGDALQLLLSDDFSAESNSCGESEVPIQSKLKKPQAVSSEKKPKPKDAPGTAPAPAA